MPTEKLPFFGKYEILGELGKGGFGRVLKARHRFLARTVALKQLAPGTITSEEDYERFRREAAVMEQLGHPNIVAIYDADIESGFPYLAMAFVEGQDVEQIVREQGPMPIDEAVRMGREMASALAHMHGAGVIHRDVKASNILRRDEDGQFFLTDFGLVFQANLTRISVGPMGSREYMSPEQIDGQVVPQSDLYSLGVVLFEVLTGRVPFALEGAHDTALLKLLQQILHTPAPPVASLRPEVPAWLAEAVARCLHKDPADRFESAEALLAALGRETTTTTPPAEPEPAETESISAETISAEPLQREPEASASAVAPAPPPPAPTATEPPPGEPLPPARREPTLADPMLTRPSPPAGPAIVEEPAPPPERERRAAEAPPPLTQNGEAPPPDAAKRTRKKTLLLLVPLALATLVAAGLGIRYIDWPPPDEDVAEETLQPDGPPPLALVSELIGAYVPHGYRLAGGIVLDTSTAAGPEFRYQVPVEPAVERHPVPIINLRLNASRPQALRELQSSIVVDPRLPAGKTLDVGAAKPADDRLIEGSWRARFAAAGASWEFVEADSVRIDEPAQGSGSVLYLTPAELAAFEENQEALLASYAQRWYRFEEKIAAYRRQRQAKISPGCSRLRALMAEVISLTNECAGLSESTRRQLCLRRRDQKREELSNCKAQSDRREQEKVKADREIASYTSQQKSLFRQEIIQ